MIESCIGQNRISENAIALNNVQAEAANKTEPTRWKLGMDCYHYPLNACSEIDYLVSEEVKLGMLLTHL
jgi:hypothetical protein